MCALLDGSGVIHSDSGLMNEARRSRTSCAPLRAKDMHLYGSSDWARQEYLLSPEIRSGKSLRPAPSSRTESFSVVISVSRSPRQDMPAISSDDKNGLNPECRNWNRHMTHTLEPAGQVLQTRHSYSRLSPRCTGSKFP